MKPGFEAYQAPTQHPLYLAVCAALGLVGERRRPRARARSPCSALVVLVWARLPPRPRGVRPVAGRWRRRSSCGSSFALPALRGAGVRRHPVPRAGRVGGGAGGRGRRAARGAPVHRRCWRSPGCCAPRRGCCAGCYWLFARLGGGLRRCSRSPRLAPAGAGRWSTCAVTGDPLFSLHATSDLAEELGASAGLDDVPRRVRRRSSPTRCARRSFAAALGGRRARLAAARMAGGRTSRSRCWPPGRSTFVGTGSPACRCCRATSPCRRSRCRVRRLRASRASRRCAPGARRGGAGARSSSPRVAAVGVFVVVKAPRGRRGSRPSCASSARTHDELVRAARAARGAARPALRAPDLPNYRLVPDARWVLDLPRERVGARQRSAGSTAWRCSTSTARRSPLRLRRRREPDAPTRPTRASSPAGRFGRSPSTSPAERVSQRLRPPTSGRRAVHSRPSACGLSRSASRAQSRPAMPSCFEPLPQRRVLCRRGLAQRPGAQLLVRARPAPACARSAAANARRRRHGHRARPGAHAGEVAADGAPAEPGVLEDAVREAGVVERLDLERDDADVGARGSAAPPPSSLRRPARRGSGARGRRA